MAGTDGAGAGPAGPDRQRAHRDAAVVRRHIAYEPLPHLHAGLRERWYPTGEPEVELIEVHTERMDDDLPAGYAPDLIKIDVEGTEQTSYVWNRVAHT